MRLSELSGKEIIHLANGKRLGVLGQTDLLFNEETGKIQALLIPESPLFFRKNRSAKSIDWQQIETIGDDMVLIKEI